MTDVARIRTLVAELDELLAAAPAAVVDPLAYPSNVAPGELIASAWGNNVTNTINQWIPNMPLGVRGYKVIGAEQVAIAQAEVALTGLRVDYTEVVGRAYVVLASVLARKGGPDVTGTADLLIKRNGVTSVGRGVQRIVAGETSTCVAVVVWVGTSAAPAFFQCYGKTVAGFVNMSEMVLVVAELGSPTFP